MSASENRGQGGRSHGVRPEQLPVAPPRSPVPALAHLVLSEPHDLGEGRIEDGRLEDRAPKVLRIDATGVPPELIGRLLVGSYITGQDQVVITARDGLTAAQRVEVHHVIDRTLGMSVVGDSPSMVEVQNFVDPGKYALPRLLHRVVQLLHMELEACHAALVAKEPSRLALMEILEEEVDQLYLLMVRQLLLSSESRRIAHDIDVESPHFQIGDRLVAKVLEVTGDLIHGMGVELRDNLTRLEREPPSVARELAARIERLDHLLIRTMDAFTRLSVTEANATLNALADALPKESNPGLMFARRISNRRTASAAQRMACDLVMGLEMMIIVNEVTINRSVEPETVARNGTRVLLGARGAPASSRSTRTEMIPTTSSPEGRVRPTA